MSLSPKHERAALPASRRPYRDTALLYGVLALVVVLVAWLTGGAVARAAAVSAGFFVVATAWSWFRIHRRLRNDSTTPASTEDP